MIEALPLVFGVGRQELIANAGIAGGIAMSLAVLAMLAVTILPNYSESWAERLGTTDTTPSGPDPKEVIPGREGPIAAPGAGRDGSTDASNDVAETTEEADAEGSTAIPEPETAGEDDATATTQSN